MTELIRELLKLWILKRTPKIELRRSKLESLAREFVPSTSGTTTEERIKDAFRLGRIWMSELDHEGDA